MTQIYLYGVEATYAGGCDFEWQAPTVGGRHKVILFLAQDDETSREDRATSELARFGFVELHVGAGRPIEVESLNDPRMHVFKKHYEGALVEGCSLVWYP
ncbi:hypothetical protein SAMN05518845_102564 [Variovorax sp. YR750]|uniref:hypothetical protein n=1 Tax=Variovorax sp. YR750 TaxID=1884384 RepID=UPI0008BEE785|nr:hypothetical protein [Variovorax sp. YR750]SEK73675.1 hypothetical protein SAMN05518845_102564 [Variovorax sp. YR750]